MLYGVGIAVFGVTKEVSKMCVVDNKSCRGGSLSFSDGPSLVLSTQAVKFFGLSVVVLSKLFPALPLSI